MYTDEQRFVWDYDDLLDIVQNQPTPSNLVRASGILRRMMIDGENSLLQKVAKKWGFKPRFNISQPPIHPPMGERAQLLFSFYDPRPSPDSPSKRVTLDEFLAAPLSAAGDTVFTIKQLVLYAANVGGGVHYGKPYKKDNAPEIHAAAGAKLYGEPFVVQTMLQVSHIVVTDLIDLYAKVKGIDK